MLDWKQRQEVEMIMTEEADVSKKILEYYLKLLVKDFPDPMETSQHCKERVRKAVEIIRKICNKEGLDTIALVSHRRILRELSKT